MRKNIIIRLSRKNEFNWEWAFLIFSVALFWILSFTVRNPIQIILILFGFTIILISAALYQGFEIIKE